MFREWLLRQPDEWLSLRGFLLLYDGIGRHGTALKEVLEAVKPRILPPAHDIDPLNRATGLKWDVRRELTVLESMISSRSPLEGMLSVLASGEINFVRCQERLPRVFRHTPAEHNVAIVLQSLPRFRWASEAANVLNSLLSSGGGNGLQHRRPPLPVGGLEAAWEEALNDERELFTCFPQFSPKLGHAVAAACLTIHGASGRAHHGELSSSRSLEEFENDRELARALLRGEVPLLGGPDAAKTPVIHNVQTSPAFLIGRLASTSRAERASFVQGLETRERDQLKTFFTNPMSLSEFWQVPASVRADLCRDARTLNVIEPTPVDHALRSLDGKELRDETLTAILQLTVASLGKGKAEVTTLRLADSLDRITALSRPLDLAAFAVERFGVAMCPG